MKRVFTKLLGIFIIVTLTMQNSFVYALTEKEKLEKDKSKINQQLDEMEKKQKELESKKSTAMKAVEEAIDKVLSSQDEIEKLEGQINALKEQITSKEKDIQQKQEEYDKQEELLNARLIAIYKNGKMSYLELLLTSKNLSDFLSKYYTASKLIEYDKDLIHTTQEQKKQIEAEKIELENNKKQLDTSLEESEKKNKELKKLQQEKEKYAKELTDEEKKVQKEIEELEAANREIQRQIKIAEEKYRQQLEALENSSSSTVAGSGFFMRPISGGTITARAYYSSGKFHGAIDYATPVGTPVYAAADGVVLLTANYGTSTYGTYLVIRHANGLQSYYAHGKAGSISVSAGQTVKKGQKIMLSGNTGNSTGPHLHFEARKSPYTHSRKATAYGDDSRVDPQKYM